MTDRQAWQHIKRQIQQLPSLPMAVCCEITELRLAGEIDNEQAFRLHTQLRRHRPRFNSRALYAPYWWPQGAKGLTARLRVCDRILARLSRERARALATKRRAKGKR